MAVAICLQSLLKIGAHLGIDVFPNERNIGTAFENDLNDDVFLRIRMQRLKVRRGVARRFNRWPIKCGRPFIKNERVHSH